MRPSLLAYLLVLSLILTEAQGARLGKGFIQENNHPKQKVHEGEEEGSVIKTSNNNDGIIIGDDEVVVGSSGTILKRTHHHWLPWIHEDYYGPRNHKPKRKYRKLMTNTTSTSSTTTITSKNTEKGRNKETKPETKKEKRSNEAGLGGKEENFSVNSSPVSDNGETYPDIIDIASMDYSPARRKPPIHN